MARKQNRFKEGTTERMQSLLTQSLTGTEIKKLQCILFRELKHMSAEDISELVGYSVAHIRRTWGNFRDEGESALIGEKRGGRYNARLTTAEEKQFLEPFFEKARKAGILFVGEVQREYEKKYHTGVHHSVIYNLLHRNGWRKIVPRPSHPKSDEKKQKEFLESFPPKGKRSHARSAR